MKANCTSNDYFAEFLKRPVDLDRRTTLRHSNLNELRRVVSIVVNRANSLGNEWRKQLSLFLGPHCSMNAGGKDDRDFAGLDAVLDQPAHQQVNNLRAAGRARAVRHYNQDAVAGAD